MQGSLVPVDGDSNPKSGSMPDTSTHRTAQGEQTDTWRLLNFFRREKTARWRSAKRAVAATRSPCLTPERAAALCVRPPTGSAVPRCPPRSGELLMRFSHPGRAPASDAVQHFAPRPRPESAVLVSTRLRWNFERGKHVSISSPDRPSRRVNCSCAPSHAGTRRAPHFWDTFLVSISTVAKGRPCPPMLGFPCSRHSS